jgi:hypothetical protein
MKKILLAAIALSMLACSKKSSDSVAPTSGATNNTNQTVNDTNQSRKYGIYYTFKGVTYVFNRDWGAIYRSLNDGCFNHVEGFEYGSFTCQESFGTGSSYCELNQKQYPKSIFNSEDFIMTLPEDSSTFMKFVGVKQKQICGDLYHENGNCTFNGINLSLTLAATNQLSSPDIEYVSFSQYALPYPSNNPFYDVLKKDTINDNSPHYFIINKIKLASHNFNYTYLLLSGEFRLAMVNRNDTTDKVSVSGYFNDIQFKFNRK